MKKPDVDLGIILDHAPDLVESSRHAIRHGRGLANKEKTKGQKAEHFLELLMGLLGIAFAGLRIHQKHQERRALPPQNLQQ